MTEPTATKTATLVKKLDDFNGDARLYRLSEPILKTRWVDEVRDGFTHVVVSATVVPHSGPETYIFGADPSGEIVDWLELEGSFRGGLDHAEALTGAGYEVAS